MTDALKPLLENELLTDEAKEQISEAWNSKLKEAREEIETKLREEFTSRYEHDKGTLIEAVERMVEDGIKAEIAEFVQDRKALAEQRVKLANEIREARINSRKSLAEQRKLVEKFVMEQLQKEIGEFESDRRQIREAKKQLAKQIRESRVAYEKKLADRVKTYEGFIFEQLKTELSEFQQDKKALVEQRVKMISEGKKKIDETRREFIKRSSKMVESTLTDVLTKEMAQFKSDIEESRKKHFGMQMFEAFAAEYKTSFFNENKEIRTLKKKVTESDKKLAQAKQIFEQAHKIASQSQKRQKLAESRAERTVVMNELLGKLSGKQREVMAELLEGVKTTNLREAFRKYVPAVMNGNGSTALARKSESKTLTEGKKVFSGNKTKKLDESTKQEDAAVNAEIIEMKRLAGMA